MGHLFVSESLVKPYIMAIDSTLIKAKVMSGTNLNGKRNSASSGIDTDAKWGFSHTKGWIFGYKLHMIFSTASSSLYLCQPMSQQPMYKIIKSIQH